VAVGWNDLDTGSWTGPSPVCRKHVSLSCVHLSRIRGSSVTRRTQRQQQRHKTHPAPAAASPDAPCASSSVTRRTQRQQQRHKTHPAPAAASPDAPSASSSVTRRTQRQQQRQKTHPAPAAASQDAPSASKRPCVVAALTSAVQNTDAHLYGVRARHVRTATSIVLPVQGPPTPSYVPLF
jgi:hypothetical protein